MQLNDRLDKIENKTDDRFEQMDGQFKTVHQEIAEIKTQLVKQDIEIKGEIKALGAELRGEIKSLGAEVKGIAKQIDTQEFINRSVVVGFVVAVVALVIKLFLPYLVS
jgi:uncharacterized protein involved in exopolysaccharide biosynthesis